MRLGLPRERRPRLGRPPAQARAGASAGGSSRTRIQALRAKAQVCGDAPDVVRTRRTLVLLGSSDSQNGAVDGLCAGPDRKEVDAEPSIDAVSFGRDRVRSREMGVLPHLRPKR